MKKFNKPLLSNFLFLSLTSVAKSSVSMCPNHVWQEPKFPNCLLDKELERTKKNK